MGRVARIGLIVSLCTFGFATVVLPQRPSELQGRALVTTSIRTNDTEVFIVDPVTGDAFNLTKAPRSEERYPSWSPDGRRVVVTSNRDSAETFDLYIVDADGRNLRRLTRLAKGSIAYWPSWTANGTWIYFNEGRERHRARTS
jgi:TolB protein